MASTRRPPRSQTPAAAGRPNSGSEPRRLGNQGAAKRPAAPQRSGQGGNPRRLGNQQQPPRRPSGAQRRYARARHQRTNWMTWGAVAVVVVIVAVLVIVKVTGSGSPKAKGSTVADRTPAAASPAFVSAITTIPASVYNSVGIDGQTAPFVVTKGQPALTSNGKIRFVYEGGEYCPYCAVTRYSMVAALSRFGTFHNLRITSSGPNDENIPTFSFLGTTYTSKYLAFTPYEAADRLQNPLQPVPSAVSALYVKYDGNPNTLQPSKFADGRWTQPGIPFLDIDNRFITAGASPGLYGVVSSGVLVNGGPGRQAIADAIHDPSSPTGQSIDAKQFIAEANYISATVCMSDGGAPSAVCASPGVQSAVKALSAEKPVSG